MLYSKLFVDILKMLGNSVQNIFSEDSSRWYIYEPHGTIFQKTAFFR
jgi:hypothetical protein